MAPTISPRAAYAQQILREHVLEKNGWTSIPSLPPAGTVSDKPVGRICIIGAGVAGLQVALALLWCGITDFDILEATSRIGGRVYTVNFDADLSPDCPHNYYDAGAMRIPDIAAMESMMNMISFLTLEKQKVYYTYSAKTEPTMYDYHRYEYNDARKPSNDVFDGLIKDTVAPFLLPNGFDKAFADFLDSDTENMSTRMWLLKQMNQSTGKLVSYGETVYAETLDTSTGLFDQAFLETILDYYDFAEAKDWYRLDGGMSVVPKAMAKKVLNPDWKDAPDHGVDVTFNTPVVGLVDKGDTVTVQLEHGKSREYSCVFNTTPMGCLGRMDLSRANLSPQVPLPLPLDLDPVTAIRTLAYDRATKVAIKFSKPWWASKIVHADEKTGEKRYGGVSSTDLPISNVVYPSWNDGDEESHVIIVSYSWAQDATRMASLISPESQRGAYVPHDPIVQLCFKNLALLWDNQPSAADLEEMYQAHHTFAWSHEPYSAGAFALFAPGQFKNLYPMFTKPLCGNKIVVCGEAISAHHAWISGALDSAYNGVLAWALASGRQDVAEKLRKSPFAGGKGRNTQEVDTDVLWSHVRGGSSA